MDKRLSGLCFQELIDVNHQLLRLIGVSHPELEVIVQESSALGVHTKLTGAGGGGCALSLISPGGSKNS